MDLNNNPLINLELKQQKSSQRERKAKKEIQVTEDERSLYKSEKVTEITKL